MTKTTKQLKTAGKKNYREQLVVPTSNIIKACHRAIVRFSLDTLKLPEKDSGQPLLFFPGRDGHIPIPAKREGKLLAAHVPDGATDGFVVLMTGDVATGFDRTKDGSKPAVMKNDLCVQRFKPTAKSLKLAARPLILGYLTLNCPDCAIVCPTGALIPDPNGDCRVDPSLCIGHTFITDRSSTYTTPDGRQVFNRLSESQCWNCFNPGETVSTKCNLRRLRKVAYNSGMCCGNCTPYSRVTGLNLMDLCPNGAISYASGTTGGPFVINASLCTGCMICFNNIVCFNNITNNTTLKMVSYADLNTARLFITVTRITIQTLPLLPAELLPTTAYLLLKSDLDESTLKLTLRQPRQIGMITPVRISPVRNNTGIGRRLSLAVTTALLPFSPLAFQGWEGARFTLPVASALTPPFCHSGSLPLLGGKLTIHYEIHE